MNEPNTVTLGNLADGAAEELFQAAFKALLENVDDPNTDWKAKRQITLSFTVHIDEARSAGNIDIVCNTKLPSVKAVAARVFIGRHRGVLAAVEALRQTDMFPQPQGRPEAVAGTGEVAQ